MLLLLLLLLMVQMLAAQPVGGTGKVGPVLGTEEACIGLPQHKQEHSQLSVCTCI